MDGLPPGVPYPRNWTGVASQKALKLCKGKFVDVYGPGAGQVPPSQLVLPPQCPCTRELMSDPQLFGPTRIVSLNVSLEAVQRHEQQSSPAMISKVSNHIMFSHAHRKNGAVIQYTVGAHGPQTWTRDKIDLESEFLFLDVEQTAA